MQISELKCLRAPLSKPGRAPRTWATHTLVLGVIDKDCISLCSLALFTGAEANVSRKGVPRKSYN